MDRYRIADIHNEDESWSEMKKHEYGEFIKYKDYEAEMSAMCEANSNAVLGDGWRDVRKELPDASGDCIVYTLDNRIEIDEYTTNFGWYIDRVGGKVIAWMPLSVIGKPAFA